MFDTLNFRKEPRMSDINQGDARYPSKERVEKDGVLVYAEGDDLANDPEEAKRQGYKVDAVEEPEPNLSTERVERDGVLVYAEGDPIPDEDEEELKRQGLAATKKRTTAANKSK